MTNKTILNVFILVVVNFVAVDCSQNPLNVQVAGSSGSLSLNNSYETQAISVIQQNCVSCHTSSSGPAGVENLTDINNLISSGLIVVGQPTQSLLFEVIQSGQMPPTGALSLDDQQILENWITAAAISTPDPLPTPTPSASPSQAVKTSATYSSLAASIFVPYCIACHSANNMTGGYAFDSYEAVMAAVNTSQPASSVLYLAINPYSVYSANPPNPPAYNGAPMPPSGFLTNDQMNVVLQWIQNGAPND